MKLISADWRSMIFDSSPAVVWSYTHVCHSVVSNAALGRPILPGAIISGDRFSGPIVWRSSDGAPRTTNTRPRAVCEPGFFPSGNRRSAMRMRVRIVSLNSFRSVSGVGSRRCQYAILNRSRSSSDRSVFHFAASSRVRNAASADVDQSEDRGCTATALPDEAITMHTRSHMTHSPRALSPAVLDASLSRAIESGKEIENSRIRPSEADLVRRVAERQTRAEIR